MLVVLGLAAALTPARAATPADPQKWDELMLGSVKALKSNRLTDAIAQCEQAMALARGFGANDTHLSRSEVLRAEIYMWEKQNDRAERMFHEAVATCEHAVGPNHPDVVHPLVSLANFYYYVDVHYDRVAALFTRILGIVERAPNRDEHQVVLWSRNLAMVYQQMGKFAQAEPHFLKAVALAEKVDPTWLPHEQLNTAAFYRTWGRYERAEELARRALAIREAALAAAPDNVDAKLDLAVTLDELAAIHLAQHRPELAEAASRRSLALVESFMSPDQPELAPRLAGLAAALQARGKFDAAADSLRRAVAIAEKNLGADSPEIAPLLSSYASVLKELKQPAEAAAVQARADELRRRLAVARPS